MLSSSPARLKLVWELAKSFSNNLFSGTRLFPPLLTEQVVS